MFVFSLKATRKTLAMAALGVLAAVGMIVLSLCLPVAQPTGGVAIGKAATAEERVELLRALGHEVADETVREIRLPDEADETLIAYEKLLEPAGMSLMKYSGKRVKLYTYTVTNAKADETAQVHLYMYRDRVIGGDITTVGANGTQRPLIP